MKDFSFAEYFGEINTLAGLQFMPDERPYIHKPTTACEKKELLLYFGCNVLRTAHLVKTTVAVLRAMGFDFHAVGGPAHCCGIVHHLNGDPRRSQVVSANTLHHLAGYGARHVLLWCPSCHTHYDDVLTSEHHVGFSYEHLTAFIARHMDRIRFTRQIARRVALHHHLGSPQAVVDGENVQRILRAIPGVEWVDLDSAATAGRHCSPRFIDEVGRPRWQAGVTTFLQAAEQARVDAVSTVYHSCHREICGEEPSHRFAVVHFMTLLGEAIGIEHPDVYKACMLNGDVGAILDDLRPYVQANRLDPVRVRKVLRGTFSPGSEADASSPA